MTSFVHENGSSGPMAQSQDKHMQWRTFPCGDRCLVIELRGNDVTQSNRMACEIAARLLEAELAGVTDIVPSMAAVGVHYDPAIVAAGNPSVTPCESLVGQIEQLVSHDSVQQTSSGREIVLPVCYGGEYGEDLDDVASACGLTPQEVVQLHSGSTVSVLMLGFAPGHPYIGMFDERLAIGRRPTPRTSVPKGSIGLANRQSVIYPMTLPGGWSLIGRTPLNLFDPFREPPCFLNAGDRIRFKPITVCEFAEIEQQQEHAQ